MSGLNARLFPWRLFLRFVGAQALVLLVVAVLAGISFRNLVILILSLAVFSTLVGRSYFRPLGRLIQKARNEDDSVTDEDLVGRKEYEWEELELALDRMRTDLRTKTDALARERQELDVLMGAIPEAIVAVDLDSRLLFFNSRFALLFGDSKSESRPVLGEVFRAPEVLEMFRHALQDGRAESVGVQLHTRTDQQRHFSLAVTPLRRETGVVYAAVGVFHDVTEMKQAEKIRIDFVANVSHELRTPLTAIKGYTDTLSDDIQQKRFDGLEKYIGVIQRNTERLMTLIEDLLDLSSLESAGENFELSKQSVGTREITSRIIAQLEPRSTSKGIKIEAKYGAESVQTDPRRLEQVLVNLIDNSIKYGREGGLVQAVWERSPRAVVLRVKDNGPGIPREYQARLFERFFRVDKARSREIGGTGLGLAIVKHIMQRHGGSVRVQSDVGQGTEFICEFPETGTSA